MDIAAYLAREKGITLSEEQRAAVLHKGGVLLLAVPGAGKTTVIAARIAHLIGGLGVPPHSIRTLTFSRESARDMAARFHMLFGEVIPEPPPFSTIHAFCYRLMRRRFGDDMPELLAEGQQREVFRALYRERTDRYPDDDLIDTLVRCQGLVRNRLETPSQRHESTFGLPGFRELCGAYAARKQLQGLMDFDDMLEGALALLQSDASLAEGLRRARPWLLMDEAQDTTALQHAVVERIAAPDGLFIVGDEDQSIYGFRGTSAELMLALPRRYPGIAVLKTQQTFRLTPEVCEAAGRVIALCKHRYDKTMATAHLPGEAVRLLPLPSGKDQADAAAEHLALLPPGETAALLYRNNPTAFGLADALDRTGIAFRIRERQIRFKSLGVVADVLAFLALSANPGDLDAFGRVYYKMGAHISRRMVDWAMANTPAGGNVFDALCAFPEESLSSARILYAKRQIAGLAALRPEKALDRLFDNLDYMDFIAKRAGGGLRFEQDAQTLEALRAIAARCTSVSDFIARIDRLGEILALSAQANRNAEVTLSTIHSAKGMEFDHVLLLGLLDGVLPSSSSLADAQGGDVTAYEEEVRLCYVAATRAKKTLALLCPASVGDRDLRPSRFISVLLGEEEPDQRANALAGRRLFHRFFGMGTVTAVSQSDNTFRVKFDKMGERTLVLSVLEGGRIAHFTDDPEEA